MHHPQLIQEALIARRAAYAPYSHFQVGAAVLCSDGRVYHGCNIENSSYSLGNCAERTALFSAIAAGYTLGDFSALAVVGQSEGPISPCGACRQVMLELGGESMSVIRADLTGNSCVCSAGDLLPEGFDGACLPRK